VVGRKDRGERMARVDKTAVENRDRGEMMARVDEGRNRE
jgi:hypothetical protein